MVDALGNLFPRLELKEPNWQRFPSRRANYRDWTKFWDPVGAELSASVREIYLWLIRDLKTYVNMCKT